MTVTRPDRAVRPFPSAWIGLWIASDGRAVLLERRGLVVATVAPGEDQAPFMRTDLRTTEEPMVRQPASFVDDAKGRPRLVIEAGTHGVGPTYELYFLVPEHDDMSRLATADDAIDEIRALGVARVGLYDDLDDDLGVPWAHPTADDYRQVDLDRARAMTLRLGP